MNVGSKCPIVCNHSQHVCAWQLNLDCGIEVTASARIICLVSHQALYYPSEHGTSSMRKNLLAKVQVQSQMNLQSRKFQN